MTKIKQDKKNYNINEQQHQNANGAVENADVNLHDLKIIDVTNKKLDGAVEKADVNLQKSENVNCVDIKQQKPSKVKYKMGKKLINSSIGGQAVIEGVMMRGKSSMATAVRDENGKIVVESCYIKPTKKKNFLFRVPFLRGIFNFVSTMIVGMKTLMRSGEVFDGEVEPSKFEKWCAKTLKLNVYSVIMAFAVIVGIGLSIGLFFFLPQLAASGIEKLFHIATDTSIGIKIGMNFLEGVIRLIIFVIYIALTCLMKDVRRTYMYHGAEHKTISCYEHKLELTVDNAKKMSKLHDRCGTTFMFLIMIISVLVFSLTGWSDSFWVRLGLRLALIPVVAGISYEVLKLLARWDNWFVKILKAPGLWLQKLTTKEPTDDMLEVAIAAFETVMKMDADNNISPLFFDTNVNYKKAREEVEEILKDAKVDASDIDWIFCEASGKKRAELAALAHIKMSKFIVAKDFARKRASGKPLWQIFGNANFYGYTIKINEDVLCPRPETELVCEQAILHANSDTRVLDLCTGSGCIAIAIAKEAKAKIVATDISEKALAVARQNIDSNEVAELVVLTQSNMFENVVGEFNIIISNPPYICSDEIATLDKEVKQFEPHLALDGGVDGLDYYKIIAKNAVKFLTKNGVVILECGIGQAQAISQLFEEKFNCEIKKDLQGVDRIFIGTLK